MLKLRRRFGNLMQVEPMNKKQLTSVWFGIVAIVIAGLIVIIEDKYSAFYVWVLIVTLVTGGLIYSFRPRISEQNEVNHGRVPEKNEETPSRQKRHCHYSPRIAAAIITLLVLILACVSLIQYLNISRPNWWLDKAKTAAREVSNDYSHRSETYCRIAKSQASIGDITGARATAASISENSCRSDAYIAIAEILARSGDKMAALETLQQARDTAVVIDDIDTQEWFYANLATAQVELGDIDGAIATAAHIIPDDSARSSFYSDVVEAQAKSGDITAAVKTFGEVKKSQYKIYALVAIADAHIEAGEIASAKQMLNRAKEIFQSAESIEFELIFPHFVCTSIVRAEAKTGDIVEAETTAENICRGKYRAYAYKGIAEAQAVMEEIENAMATAAKIDKGTVKADTHIFIAKEEAKRGRLAAAREILRQTRNSAMGLNPVDSAYRPEDKDYVLMNTAAALAEIGYIEFAIQTAAEVRDQSMKSFAFSEIAKVQLERGNVSGALVTGTRISEYAYEMAELCYTLARAQAKELDAKQVLSWVESLKGKRNVAYACAGVAEGLYEKGVTK